MKRGRKRRAAIFLDRDGTLNADFGYISSTADIEWLPGVLQALQDLQSLGYRFIVVTNQSGVARGYFQAADVERIHRYMRSILQEEGIRDVRFLYCPHHPMGAVDRYRRTCSCRKPKPGMLLKGARRYGINLSASFMVGDRMKDKIAGMNSGCTGIRIGEYRWCRDLSVFSKYLTRKKKRTRRGRKWL